MGNPQSVFSLRVLRGAAGVRGSSRLGLAVGVLVVLVMATAASSFAVTITATSTLFIETPDAPYCLPTVLTIQGSGFINDGGIVSVTIGGVPAASYTTAGDNVVVATTAAGATTGPVVVTTQAGTATSAFKETLEPCAAGPATEKPAVSSAPARARGGKPLEFIGSGFIGVTKVTANGSPAPYSIPTDQNMYVTVPKSVPNGKVTITLTSAAGNTKVTVQKVS